MFSGGLSGIQSNFGPVQIITEIIDTEIDKETRRGSWYQSALAKLSSIFWAEAMRIAAGTLDGRRGSVVVSSHHFPCLADFPAGMTSTIKYGVCIIGPYCPLDSASSSV